VAAVPADARRFFNIAVSLELVLGVAGAMRVGGPAVWVFAFVWPVLYWMGGMLRPHAALPALIALSALGVVAPFIRARSSVELFLAFLWAGANALCVWLLLRAYNITRDTTPQI
jgi:hypothetical protein